MSSADHLDNSQDGIQSIEIAGGLLRALMSADGPQRLKDLARHASMPTAKAHRYLVSLVRIGLASQDPVSSRYDLGPMALQLGLKGFGRFDPLKFAAGALESLADLAGETCALVVWGRHGPRFIRVVEARHSQASTVAATHICPMTWSATGLVFSAHEDTSRTQSLIGRELEQNQLLGRPMAPQTHEAMSALLDRVRRQGFAIVANGGGDGTAAICVPVFDLTGRLLMALTVFAPAGRLDIRPEGGLVRLVGTTAARMSDALGFRGQATVLEEANDRALAGGVRSDEPSAAHP